MPGNHGGESFRCMLPRRDLNAYVVWVCLVCRSLANPDLSDSRDVYPMGEARFC